MQAQQALHVRLVAIPDAAISTLTGIYDVMNAFKMLQGTDDALPPAPPFQVDILGTKRGPVTLASGIAIEARCGVADLAASDIVVVPSVVLADNRWETGRYPELVAWLRDAHDRGAILCSACSGIFLLAETGLFDGVDATVHWLYADAFRVTFPKVPVYPDRVLVVSGARQQFVSSGASMTWHDLVLYLIARHVGATAAQGGARVCAAVASRRSGAIYCVRWTKAARRLRDRRCTGMAVGELLGRQPG